MGKSNNQKGHDIESGYNNNTNFGQYGNNITNSNNVQNPLYPTMLESPQLRWQARIQDLISVGAQL